ncbi:bromodomain adjacent to zinc finger domain protein 1A isoform X2 [Thrips palmi]|uniref:Bromodomain adjacent to zinc finger domain protein 1A n=1 Tax=Thrips palmi TaxID=161013 RepID=A0A6P8ZI67_THRPL|nr:bromodomain adjacent to zinc finger domain protein 1A isoform X2 [Thrips palmi]
MPLLDKKPFERNKPPRDLRSSDEVFYCPLTKEIFRDYEEYCARIILCNSLVWQCSLTGRPQLTFEEALKSEQHAKQNLKDFPMELKVPVLYLASKTHRTGILDLVEDVYIYVRDRYFVGETVEVSITEGGPWTDAYIVHVIAPSDEEIANQPPPSADVKDPQRQFQPPASMFRYEVELSDRTADDVSEVHTLPAAQVRRRPRMYSRDRNRLFLKQFLEVDGDCILRVKESELNKYKIRQYKYDQIFAGNPPVFPSSRRAVKRLQQQQLLLTKSPKRKYTKRAKPDTPPQGTPPGKKSRQETMQKYITMTKKSPNGMTNGAKSGGSTSPQKSLKDKYGKAALSGKVRKRRKFDDPQQREQLKIKAIEDKKKRREDMMKERAAKREKKLELAKFIREWNRQREDLECEDLKVLPVPTPVETKIPNKLFGDVMMAMEFLHTFSEQLKVKDFFPSGVSLELLERSLVEPEVTGPLNDLLQLLLSGLFEMQEDEEEALDETNPVDLTEPVSGNMDENDVATSEALRVASAAAAWSNTFQGKPLSKVELDSVVLTEVLRLHLLQSGNRAGEMSTEWRYRERGGYTTRDDPGLVWKMENMNILKALSTTSIFELPPEDKLSVITCLINQIMTYVAMRDVIEERMEKTKQVRVELHFADREISKKEKEMIEQSRKKRKKNNVEPEEPKANGENEESEEEEETAEQKATRLAREKKNNSDKQREIQKRKNQLMDEMLSHANLPIGTDRAHRRFWLFASLPGLFVEHDERFAGSCLDKPTPHNLDLVKMEDTLSYVCKLFEEERNGGSDKENDGESETHPIAPIGSPSKKLLSEKNHKAGGSPMKSPSQQSNTQTAEDESKPSVNHAALLTCNADPDSCPVHSVKAERTTWGFYLKDQVDDLIERLSTRGHRESELRTMLVQSKDRIVHSVEYCPISKLNPNLTEEVAEVRKSQRQKEANQYKDTLLGHPADTPLDEILELTLRDLILEMEEKMSVGGLGSLKVKNRQAWRDTIAARGYDKECDKLTWPGCDSDAYSSSIVDKIKSERFSRPGTPDSTASSSRDIKDPHCYVRLACEVANLGSCDIKPKYSCIRNLASAILQVSQGVDDRYLKKPLGLSDKEKEKSKEKQRKNEEQEDGEKEKAKEKEGLTVLQKWQVSLMTSTSFSQLFLHLSTLDSSIQWSKSALNANCRLCRRRGDPDQMLLCDGCNKGHHMYCLKPKLTSVPKGDWFCPTCKPKEKKTPAKKPRKVFDDDEDNLESILESEEQIEVSKEPCKSCGKDGSDLQCEKCSKCFHLSCAEPRLRKAPRGKWTCEKCKIKASSSKKPDDDHEDPEPEVENDESEERQLHSRRRCAVKAVANISNYAKQLRNQNYDDALNDEGISRRRSRRSLDVDTDDLPLDNAALQELLEEIIRHKDAWAFTRPVLKSEVPDYHTIIKRPMDFGTIRHKLNVLDYRNTSEVLADALLVFENCDMYNQPDTDVYKSGVRLRKFFDKKCREKNLRLREEDVKMPDAKKKRSSP